MRDELLGLAPKPIRTSLYYPFRNRTPNSMFISERIIAKMKACQNPAIENPGTIYAASNTIPAFITSAKKPSVMKVSGNAIIEITGRTNKFITVSTAAKIKAGITVVCTPGTTYVATTTERVASIHWKKRRLI